MSRLPVVGADLDAWGAILNDYLLQGHTAGGLNKTPVVVALPATPANGDEVILVDSLTVPTFAWRFVYLASITDAYKWLFLGGSPVRSAGGTVTVPGGQAANVGVDVAGFPTLPVPRTGLYRAHYGCEITNNGGFAAVYQAWARPYVGAAAILPSVDHYHVPAAFSGGSFAQAGPTPALSQGDPISFKAGHDRTGNSTTFTAPWLELTPLRVS